MEIFATNRHYVHSTPTVGLATEDFVPSVINVRVTVYAAFELE